ncbi:STAS domain-containing protein [Verrucomicrobium sp. BvORR034]|jgi:rsbT co-antagonist protein RsbR|uniref:STAS domain-containing protein n=1 Tax=Verrucomicrobium sp. BvORR034 TaxID=1396418 RepID=UPI000678EEB2|nr:STAS domain-containing protein [Verrucomicrobium sp. BvORR034]
MSSSVLATVISNGQEDLLKEWVQQQLQAEGMRRDLIKVEELTAQSREFLQRFQGAVGSGDLLNIRSMGWSPVLESIGELSRQRGRMGFTPTETALFVLSLKAPLTRLLREAHKDDPIKFIEEITVVGELLDKLGLFTMEVFLQSREEVIIRQQEDMLELSTPVVKLWDGIVALPIIGTLDSARTSVVMESLLQRIVETGSEIAIIDITGVPTVDTLVAQHLLKTVAAARLMGADCIISGIRPQIAQTMVHLAIDLSAVTTKATLAEALKTALQRNGMKVVSSSAV